MRQRDLHRVFQLLLVFLIFVGCASSTVIDSDPQGAKVFVNGELKGTTPYTYSDRKTIGSTTNITLKKEGYEEFSALLVRNEEFDPGACAGGIFLVPFLWVQKYSPSRTYELTSLSEGEEVVEDISIEPEPESTPAPTAKPAPAPAKANAKAKKAKPAKKPAPKN